MEVLSGHAAWDTDQVCPKLESGISKTDKRLRQGLFVDVGYQ